MASCVQGEESFRFSFSAVSGAVIESGHKVRGTFFCSVADHSFQAVSPYQSLIVLKVLKLGGACLHTSASCI